MIFFLKNIEVHLEEKILLTGEKLFADGKVKDLKEVERHLWLSKVEAYEVEIQITPGKVRACTCECASYLEAKMCEHVAATLLALRKRLSENEKAKAPKIHRRKIPNKLTAASILENARQEELFAFVRQFAKENRHFSMALKARFAASVPVANPREKYLQLLHSTIKGSLKKDESISFRGIQNILNLSGELLKQTDDLIALANYAEGFIILQCLIEKLAPIIQRAPQKQEKISQSVQAAFSRIHKIYQYHPAPVLKEKIWDFCLRECCRRVYRINHIAHHFFDLLIRFADSKVKLQILLKTIDDELVKENSTPEFKAGLFINKLDVLKRRSWRKEVNAFVLSNLNSPDFLILVTNRLWQKGDLEKAKFMAGKGLAQDFSKGVRHDLEETLLEIALLEKDHPAIVHFAENRFLDTADFTFYEHCKNHFEGSWETFIEGLVKAIEKWPFSTQKRDTLAAIFATENRALQLLGYIRSMRSLELLQRYDSLLLEEHKSMVYQLYEELLAAYLNDHLGPKPSLKTRDVIAHLHQIGAKELADKLLLQIRQNYSERHSLMEELEIFGA